MTNTAGHLCPLGLIGVRAFRGTVTTSKLTANQQTKPTTAMNAAIGSDMTNEPCADENCES